MLEKEYPWLDFAISPENLRRGRAMGDFRFPGRTIMGIRKPDKWRHLLDELFEPFGNNIIYMDVESAEMVKHALNGFLGLSIAYINEIARICKVVGANPAQVSKGLKSDHRIGQYSYLSPGGPFTGGTIGRDLVHMQDIIAKHGLTSPIISAVIPSNNLHEDLKKP